MLFFLFFFYKSHVVIEIILVHILSICSYLHWDVQTSRTKANRALWSTHERGEIPFKRVNISARLHQEASGLVHRKSFWDTSRPQYSIKIHQIEKAQQTSKLRLKIWQLKTFRTSNQRCKGFNNKDWRWQGGKKTGSLWNQIAVVEN